MKFIFALLFLVSLSYAGFYDVWSDSNETYQTLPESFEGYFDETLKPWSEQRLSAIALNANGENVHQNAIITSHANLRAWPSDKPLFRNPQKVAEGYPFDYAQHSRLYIGMPIKILKQSADKNWYFAITPVNYGWIETSAVAFVDVKMQNFAKSQQLCTPLIDDETMQNELNTQLKVGMILPCDENTSYVPAKKDDFAIYVKSPKLAQIPIDENLRRKTALSLLGKPYGWGGIYGDRDCSALTRDVFIPAGVFLKRNSKQQAAPNEKGYVDLSKFDAEAKKKFIIQTATPWQTLLYMPGHIVLYIGQENGEPMILQAVWGIKTFDFWGAEGRYIIGETIISSLDINKSVKGYDEQKSSLAPKIIGMRTIGF